MKTRISLNYCDFPFGTNEQISKEGKPETFSFIKIGKLGGVSVLLEKILNSERKFFQDFRDVVPLLPITLHLTPLVYIMR